MTKIVFKDRDANHMATRVEIMSNGWVKAIDEVGDIKEYTQYPPNEVKEVQGDVVYYE